MTIINKLLQRFSRKTYSGSTWLNFGDLKSTWNSKNYLRTYADSTYVYSCVRKRAEKVGQIKFQIFKGDKQQEDNEILNILNRPNEFQSKSEFFELYQIYKDLSGSTFIWIERDGKKIVGLHNLRPDCVTELRNKNDGSISGYRYTANSKAIIYEPEEIIASRYPSPLSTLVGHSPVESARNIIDTEIQLSTYHNNVMRNGGRVEGVLTHKVENLTELQLTQMKKEFSEKYAGARNSGRPLFLYGGLEYKNMGLTPTELSYIDSKKFTRDDILTVFGVPLPIIAQSDVGALGSSGYDAALKIFLSETIKPLMDNLVDKLNNYLVPDDLELKYVDPSPEDTELKIKIAESGIKNYFMTQNEARNLFNLEPIKNGDTILVPFNLTEQEVSTTNSKKKSIEHPLKDEAVRKSYYNQFSKGLKKDIRIFKKELKGYFQDQLERLLNQIETKNIFQDKFNFIEENRLGKELFIPILQQIFEDSGKSVFDLYGNENEFVITPLARETLERRAEFFVGEINNTTFDELTDLFDKAQEAGKTRAELVEDVKALYSDRIETSRATTIVKTESHIATEEGKLSGYKQMNVQIKIWVHNPISKDPRAEHEAIDGEEVPIDSRFSNGLLYPGDGGPDQSINCNCTI